MNEPNVYQYRYIEQDLEILYQAVLEVKLYGCPICGTVFCDCKMRARLIARLRQIELKFMRNKNKITIEQRRRIELMIQEVKLNLYGPI
jgi:hypothetical protein